MRTTLNLEDDVLDFAKSLAELRKISVGQAVSELARKGMNAKVEIRLDPVTGFWLFDVPEDAPVLTSEDVRRAIEQEYLDEYERAFPKQ